MLDLGYMQRCAVKSVSTRLLVTDDVYQGTFYQTNNYTALVNNHLHDTLKMECRYPVPIRREISKYKSKLDHIHRAMQKLYARVNI